MRFLAQKFTLPAAIVLLLFAGAVHSKPVHADDSIATDGACNINIQYDEGRSSTWYIELQRDGQSYISQGVAQENDSEIRYGLTTFDWGFAHQSSNGSFGTTGDAYHSTSLFIESAAYITLLLKSYHPSTYTLNQSFYNQKIATYTAGIDAACKWITQPAIENPGKVFDIPYTSRYYTLASMLGQASELTGDTSFAADAVPFAKSAMALQWPDGVNPELGGYDVEYQEAGVLNATHYYTTIQYSNPTLAKSVNNMMKKAMVWETKRINVNGVVNIAGSTRVGIERNRDGSMKTLDSTELEESIYNTYQETRLQNAIVAYERMMWVNKSPSSADIAPDGSVDYNTTWEEGNRSKWAVEIQRAGADYVEYGIQREDDTAIRLGLSCIDWSFAHQTSDGTFVGTSTQFIGGAIFVESAARAMLDLETYQPVTYTLDKSFYNSELKKDTADCLKFANWMILSANAGPGEAGIATSTSEQYGVAAALQETGALTGTKSLETAAVPYANIGLKMLKSGGINPESGAFDLNDQAQGIVWACYFCQNNSNATLETTLESMLTSTLSKEGTYINSSGDISGSSPDIIAIQAAFDLGYPVTGDDTFSVVYDRMVNINPGPS